MPACFHTKPGKPCSFLYNTGRESTSRKRRVNARSPESQTDFPCRQAEKSGCFALRRPQLGLSRSDPSLAWISATARPPASHSFTFS